MPRLSKIGAAALAAFGWTGISSVSASYLVVAGGGAGGGIPSGGASGGGGGAGGLLTGSVALNPTLSYTVTVGAGGASSGTQGSNSVFSTITSTGGGFGGKSVENGGAGGSGGGSCGQASGAGSGTVGQGNNGGVGSGFGYTGGGGGGGAGAVGGNANGATLGGPGGNGLASSISGASVTYAGGGGGGTNNSTTQQAGGTGGGGTGGSTSVVTGGNGTANLGAGGGGGGGSTLAVGGSGGSGIVIISYVGAQQFSGGVVTSSGGNTIHTFTTSGTLGPVTPLSANYLVVAGGGGGGGTTTATYSMGGGGAGGLLTGSALVIDPYSTYVVTVGAGGIAGSSGSNSVFVSVTSTGGGSGGRSAGSNVGANGGSGGGGAGEVSAPVSGGTGTSGQGNNGGTGNDNSNTAAGGGGGASAIGANATTSNVAGAGGNGTASSISGSSVTYAGGGGGGAGYTGGNGTGGAGGTGGGGTGSGTGAGTSGTANLGGGGGGGKGTSTSGAGGSGIVIISYAGSTQLMAGGVVTIAGGNVIHTFNSSGYLTPLTLLTNSLRFRSSASAYLSRTLTTPTNNKVWTWSAWVKRGTLGSVQSLFGQRTDGNNQSRLYFDSTNTLTFYNQSAGTINVYLITNAVFRDPAAYYHIVLYMDAVNSATRIYVNGVLQTLSTNTTANVSQFINSAAAHTIGEFGTGYYLDGYLTEVNFIDGQALAPTAFGTVNSYGVWQPITYGGSYGTNGFRLPFTNNASTTTLGYDFSPQGNNWTTNNISVTAGVTYDSMTDVPTLTSATAANYCVLNFLDKTTGTLSNGNLTWYNAASSQACVRSTMAIPTTGKWYWEAYLTNPVGANSSGIALSTFGMASFIGDTNSWAYHTNGYKYVSGVGTAGFGNTGATGNIFSYDFDSSTGTLRGYWNGTLQGTIVTGLPVANYFAAYSSYGGGQWDANFGQRPFTYTPPTGFVALNTFNL